MAFRIAAWRSKPKRPRLLGSALIQAFYQAAVYLDRDARDVARALRRQEHHDVGELFGLADPLQRRLLRPTILDLLLRHALPLGEFPAEREQARRRRVSGADAIYQDVVRAVLVRQRLDEPADAGAHRVRQHQALRSAASPTRT